MVKSKKIINSVFLGLVFLVVSLAMVLIIDRVWEEKNQKNKSVSVLRIAMTAPWSGYAPLFIAAGKGFFREHGLQVEIIPKDNFLEVKEAMQSGEADLMIASYATILTLDSPYTSKKLFYLLNYSDGADAIVAGQEIKSVRDLRGKRIGITAYDNFSYIFVARILKKYGLDISEVTMVEVSEEEMGQALESNLIDAAHTWEPYLSSILNDKNKILITSVDAPGIVEGLATREEIIEGRLGDLKNLVSSLSQASEYIKRNKNEVATILGKRFGQSQESIRESFFWINFLDLDYNMQSFFLDKSNKGYVSLKEEAGKMLELFNEGGVVEIDSQVDQILNTRVIKNKVVGYMEIIKYVYLILVTFLGAILGWRYFRFFR